MRRKWQNLGRDEIIRDKCIAKEEKKSPQVLVSLNMTMETSSYSVCFLRVMGNVEC